MNLVIREENHRKEDHKILRREMEAKIDSMKILEEILKDLIRWEYKISMGKEIIMIKIKVRGLKVGTLTQSHKMKK